MYRCSNFLKPAYTSLDHACTSQPRATSLASSISEHLPSPLLTETFVTPPCTTSVASTLVFVLTMFLMPLQPPLCRATGESFNTVMHDVPLPCLKSFTVFQSAYKNSNCLAVAQRLCGTWPLVTSPTHAAVPVLPSHPSLLQFLKHRPNHLP